RPAGGGGSTASEMVAFASPAGKLLMAMTSTGPAAFEPDVPNVWVTAPTHHCDGLGFVLNGDFERDLGRTQLLDDSQANVVGAGDGRFVVGQAFAAGERPRFDVVSARESFRGRVQPGKAVSALVAQTLEHLGVRTPAGAQVTLADVVEFELDGDRAEPASAA